VPRNDPISSGVTKSFAHPADNITGVANMYGDPASKTLDFLLHVLPNANERFVAEKPNDLEAASEAMKSANRDAVYVLADPRSTVPELALKFGLPSIYEVDTSGWPESSGISPCRAAASRVPTCDRNIAGWHVCGLDSVARTVSVQLRAQRGGLLNTHSIGGFFRLLYCQQP
jgi:hypothetical protein